MDGYEQFWIGAIIGGISFALGWWAGWTERGIHEWRKWLGASRRLRDFYAVHGRLPSPGEAEDVPW